MNYRAVMTYDFVRTSKKLNGKKWQEENNASEELEMRPPSPWVDLDRDIGVRNCHLMTSARSGKELGSLAVKPLDRARSAL